MKLIISATCTFNLFGRYPPITTSLAKHMLLQRYWRNLPAVFHAASLPIVMRNGTFHNMKFRVLWSWYKCVKPASAVATLFLSGQGASSNKFTFPPLSVFKQLNMVCLVRWLHLQTQSQTSPFQSRGVCWTQMTDKNTREWGYLVWQCSFSLRGTSLLCQLSRAWKIRNDKQALKWKKIAKWFFLFGFSVMNVEARRQVAKI